MLPAAAPLLRVQSGLVPAELRRAFGNSATLHSFGDGALHALRGLGRGHVAAKAPRIIQETLALRFCPERLAVFGHPATSGGCRGKSTGWGGGRDEVGREDSGRVGRVLLRPVPSPTGMRRSRPVLRGSPSEDRRGRPRVPCEHERGPNLPTGAGDRGRPAVAQTHLAAVAGVLAALGRFRRLSRICISAASTVALSGRLLQPGGGMADARDLKSLSRRRECGFESRPGHPPTLAAGEPWRRRIPFQALANEGISPGTLRRRFRAQEHFLNRMPSAFPPSPLPARRMGGRIGWSQPRRDRLDSASE